MREYIEQQLKKKAHELVMTVFRVSSRAKKNKSAAISLRQIVSKIPVAVFEGQARDYDEDKMKYFSDVRNSIFEARYYLDLLYSSNAITYYSYKQTENRLSLLDKMVVSRIRSLDKRVAKEHYNISIRTKHV